MNKALICYGWGIASLFVACGGEDDGQLPLSPRSFSVRFAAQMGDEAISCGEPFSGLGATPDELPIQLKDFRLFIHDLRVIDSEGNEVSAKIDQSHAFNNGDIALLDFEDGSGQCGGTEVTHTELKLEAEIDEIKGLAFTIGVPPDKNHINTATAESPFNIESMYWNWQAGFKFLRVEFSVEDRSNETGNVIDYAFHLGSTGCESETGATPPAKPCENPNYPKVSLDTFDPESDVVVFDLGNLLEGTDLTSNQLDTASGCHSFSADGDCTPLFRNLGLSFSAGSCESDCQDQSFVVVASDS